MRRVLMSLSAALLAVGCSSGPQPKPPEPAPAAPAPAPVAVKAPSVGATPVGPELIGAIDVKALDPTTNPCDDFYQYACGNWLKTTKIPADKAVWTRSFSSIYEKNEQLLRTIVESAAAGKADPADPFVKKVGDFYGTCMDEPKAETASLKELKSELAKIKAVKTPRQLATLVGEMHQTGAGPFFNFGSEQDAKDATLVIAGADQGGLGLPDRDYYLKDDAKMKAIRDAYVAHVEKMLTLAGEPAAQAKTDAADILTLETALAKASMDKVDRRDPYKVYHRLERKGLVKLAPHFDWKAYFTARQHPAIEQIDVIVPDFFAGLDKVLTSTPMPKLQAYLRWHEVSSASNALGKDFVNARFDFMRTLTGQKELAPRWKRCVAMTDGALGEAVGRTFVQTTIGDKGKADAKAIVHGIEAAMGEDLKGLSWMDDATKKAAAEKLSKVNNKIGYPDKWRDYTSMKIGTSSLLKNRREADRFESNRDLNKIGKPVDRDEWGMTPATVNAYYNPSLNEMVFPAGILQDPFFGPEKATAANFGGAGMVMGHELTHGFDDQGRQYDGDGNLRDWWTKASADAYNTRTACVANQYDQYIAVDDVHLNGKLTLGENIADIGGLKLSRAALMAKNGGKLTQDQERVLFISFAQDWCTVQMPQMARLRATVDPHSSSQWRVNGPVTDNPDFARVFGCEANTKMNPANRCQVW